MYYVTLTDVETRLGATALLQLTDDGQTGQVDTAVVAEAVDGAEGEVHSHLALRYSVPVNGTVHPGAVALLRTVVLDLVEHRLHARRPPVPAEVSARGAAAVRWLEAVGAGRAVLPGIGEGIRAAVAGNEKVLSREELEDY